MLRKSDEDAFFITPFCEMGDLDDAMELRKFGPLQALDALLQVAAGVSYLHARRLLHRDLKPSNIFCLANGCFVIGDFGSVVPQNAEGCAKTLTRHSLLYRPPEEISTKTIFRQSDIYQLGLLFFQLLGGYLPYDEYDWLSSKQKTQYASLSKDNRQFYASEIIEGKISKNRLINLSALPAWIPQSFKNFIRKSTAADPDRRFETVAEMAAKLNNLRSSVPDWRIEEHAMLFRKNKTFRILEKKGDYFIEKNVGGKWRAERRYQPSDMSEAVAMAESL